MRIVKLTAENVKRLKAVEISPNGAVQIVAGRNAQGKSSVLDAIWMALDWKAASKTTPRPVRDGEDTARVCIELDDLTVTRKWSNGNTSLIVESRDGKMRPKRPQELLDSLLGHLSFDPLAFTQQSGREQVQTLLGLVDLPFDPAVLDGERAMAYEARTEVGRDLTRAKGALESLPVPLADLPAEEISSADIMREYEAAQREIQERADCERRMLAAQNERRAAMQAQDVAEVALRAAQERYEVAARAAVDAQDAFDAFAREPEPDINGIKERLAGAEDTNAQIRAAKQHRAAKAAVDALQAVYDEKSRALGAIDKRKADGLAAAKFPIAGLSFDEGGVTYNGVPFCQASSGEQLRVSLALAMATNPTLRVIRITDGSLLDGENMALIEQMATDNDYQCWIEVVSDTAGPAGVYIEDGSVVAS